MHGFTTFNPLRRAATVLLVALVAMAAAPAGAVGAVLAGCTCDAQGEAVVTSASSNACCSPQDDSPAKAPPADHRPADGCCTISSGLPAPIDAVPAHPGPNGQPQTAGDLHGVVPAIPSVPQALTPDALAGAGPSGIHSSSQLCRYYGIWLC